MKKTLSIMIMAAALLLMTQCRKDEMPAVMPEANTVSMTVTAGSGSKTDISAAGAIKWSDNDKIYVGHNGTYVGYLTLVSGAGSATGTFSGDVTLPDGTTGEQTFHFFYLGSGDYTSLTKGTSTTAEVDFSRQDGSLANASAQHVGYGSASGTVKGGIVTGINVTLVSKVALARFSFTKDGEAYDGALTLSSTNIFNKMTVNFNANDFTPVKDGNISLTNTTTSEKYVMLVPTVGTGDVALSFASGGKTGVATIEGGIHENKFYGMKDAIAVTLEAAAPAPKFSVGENSTVEFAPGNLWYGKADGEETAAFHFEANQWGTDPTSEDQWNPFHVSHFKWSDADNAVTDDNKYSGDLFCASNFTVDGDSHTWRTLSSAEWAYLLNTSGSSGRNDANRFAKALVNGVCGLLVFPDGYTLPSGYTMADGGTGIATLNATDAAYPDNSIPDATWTSMETSGAVFLPAAGYRNGTDVSYVGSYGYYWSSTPSEYDEFYAYFMSFSSGSVSTIYGIRPSGYSVRLVW